ncbi:MAG: 16S rRNA (guanine(966)-N(2))-methyltransferase RsmD [Eubacterium sp.]|nr:16S rRNA (guanine(966)-N(2))-methyltransferase RsmD [Eubacterium sp.]
MRVIAGTARHLPLKAPAGRHTRPTGDKIKETLFNILHYDMPGARFLDLFAGSGAIGIEALSRGAEFAAFVDNDGAAIRCVEENLDFTGFTERSLVLKKDYVSAFTTLKKTGVYDVIFADPPYADGVEKTLVDLVDSSGLLAEDGTFIMEAALDTDFSFVEDTGLEVVREKTYKTSKHVFMEIKK